MQRPIIAFIAVAALGMAAAGAASAQPHGAAPLHQDLKRNFLQTTDVPRGDYQVILGTSGIGANKSGGRQSHPGPELGYVLQGSGSILLDGKPAIQLRAGQSYKLAPGEWHEARGGPHGVKLLVAWIVEKGKPLTSP